MLHVRIATGVVATMVLVVLIACNEETPDIEATVEARIAEKQADEAARAAEIQAGVAATMVALAAPTLVPTPTETSIPIPTSTPTATSLPTATPEATYAPLPTHTPLPSYTPIPTPTYTPIPTSTPTSTYTPTPTPTPTNTSTPTASPTPTATHTPIPTNTLPPTPTPETSISDVVDQARKSVVHIVGSTGSGSGFMVESTGYILTNAHVVEGTTDLTVVLDGGLRTSGKVVKLDTRRDIALVKIDRGHQPILRFAISARIGEDVVALGYPFGTDGLENMTISTGVVSAFQLLNGINYVQTDAAVNPGNSGGPLLDMNGRVVGMNTFGIRKDISEGLNFAIHYSILSERLKVMIAEANAPPTPTPTRTPTPTPRPTLVGSFGPVDGSIEHDPDDGKIDTYEANVTLEDGIIEARFFNPYASETGRWGSGFLFRTGPGQFHTVFVTQSGDWYHYLRTDDASNDQQVGNGFSAAIATGAYDNNLIRIIVSGEAGVLFVNGKFVAILDLSEVMDAGGVYAIVGYFAGDGVEGKSTQFEDFKITPIQPTPSFERLEGSIEHYMPNTGQIDGYSADLSLVDGIIEARFFNPYASQTGSWSSGFSVPMGAVTS